MSPPPESLFGHTHIEFNVKKHKLKREEKPVFDLKIYLLKKRNTF